MPTQSPPGEDRFPALKGLDPSEKGTTVGTLPIDAEDRINPIVAPEAGAAARSAAPLDRDGERPNLSRRGS